MRDAAAAERLLRRKLGPIAREVIPGGDAIGHTPCWLGAGSRRTSARRSAEPSWTTLAAEESLPDPDGP